MKIDNKSILFTDIGVVDVQTQPLDIPDTLQRDDLLLQTEYTLISPGTEMDCLMARIADKSFPKCLGYSAVARVLRRGAEATDFQEGARVLVYHSSHRAFLIKNKADVVKVPDGLSPEEAIFAVTGCMGLQGVRKVRLELGESLMVMGLGLLGQVALQAAARSGAFPCIALDFNPLRRDIALRHGADAALAPDDPDLTAKLRDLTHGQGLNAVIEVTGNPEAVKQGLAHMAPFGRIALVGCSRTPTTDIDFYNLVHRPGIEIIGAHNFARPKNDSYPGYWTMRKDMATLMELIRAGRINTRDLITDIAKPEDAPAMYRKFIDRDPNTLGVIFNWTQA